MDLAINPNTVVKAYRQLEHEGLAGGRPGQGTFITGTPAQAAPPRRPARRCAARCGAGWPQAAAAGLSEEAITALIAAARRDTTMEDEVG